MIKNYPQRGGHAAGHVRETFSDAVYAFMNWTDGPEPTVPFDVHYKEHQIPISRACTLVWNCTDTIPGTLFNWLRDDGGLEMRLQTYAACARAMRAVILMETNK